MHESLNAVLLACLVRSVLPKSRAVEELEVLLDSKKGALADFLGLSVGLLHTSLEVRVVEERGLCLFEAVAYLLLADCHFADAALVSLQELGSLSRAMLSRAARCGQGEEEEMPERHAGSVKVLKVNKR